MTSRQRIYSNIPRPSTRPDKYRASPTPYLHPSPPASPPPKQQQLDHTQDLIENRYCESPRNYSPDNPIDDDYKNGGSDDSRSTNGSASMYNEANNANESEDVEQYYREAAETKHREKFLQDAPYKRVAYNNAAYDALQRRSVDYVESRKYNTEADQQQQQHHPHSIATMQKMQKLRELQRRRDLTEKFYSDEIRRLIGDQYFESRPTSPAGRAQEPKGYSQAVYDERLTSGALQNLERCGTMTTVTRLDCGCMEQTLKPIFTTPNGRVQRRNCSVDQHTRITGPSAKLILASPAHHNQPRLKSKSFGYATMKGVEHEQQRAVSRSNSPGRRISETSV